MLESPPRPRFGGDRRVRVPLPPPKGTPPFGVPYFLQGIRLFNVQNVKHRRTPTRGGNMPKKGLTGKKIAILVDEGFEQVELIKPRKALDKAGAQTKVVSPQEGEVRGWNMKKWGKSVAVDVPLDSADPSEFDALLLPGGVMNPDNLRMNPKAVEFVKHFTDSGKPVAAICHGPWTLIEAGGVQGRTVTSWPSL